MTDQKDTLLNFFKEANQSLRKRAITLGVLMIVTIGLTYTESNRLENVSNLLNYQFKLEELMKMPDSTFTKGIEDNFEAHFPFSIYTYNPYFSDRNFLLNKVKAHGMQRSFIEDGIEDVNRKIEQQNEEKAISILGLNIPLKPVVYVGMLIILILFHDFTQIMIYRNEIHRQIRRIKIKNWELGVEFFGSYHRADQASLKFLRVTTAIVTGFLILCPVITSFMIIRLNNNYDGLPYLLNIIGFSIVIIDTVIVFYTTNIWNFRYLSNWYLGNYRVSIKDLRFMWLLSLVSITIFQLAMGMEVEGEYAMAGLDYFILSVLPVIALYITLEVCHKKRNSLWRSIRAGLLVLNIFWFFAMLSLLFSYFTLDYWRITSMYGTLGICTLICGGVSFVYMKFFMVNNRPTVR